MQIARRLPLHSENAAVAPPFKQVLTEICNNVHGSNSWWRGRSLAASVPSDTPPQDKKVRKKLPKAERKAMVESFVTKYRAMNSGRFPGAYCVQKEVGGGYYVIRKIVQELEHKSKISSMKSTSESSLGKEVAEENEPLNEEEEVSSNQMTVDGDILRNAQMRSGTVMGKEVTKASEPSIEVLEVSSCQMIVDAEIHKDTKTVATSDVETVDSGGKNFQRAGGPETPILETTSAACDISESVAMQSHLLYGEAEEVLHPCSEKPKENIKLKSPSDEKQDFEEHKPGQQQELFELEEFERVSPKEQTDDEKLQKRSSVWGSLKSFAGGIINIWRKL